MQDSIIRMTITWHFIDDFAVKHDVSAIDKRDVIEDVTA